ncbi:NAD(P)H-dependent flavin oxidoreductase [Heliophilum fasciatum]|uniref:Probable nitronate monooxygenase n=1 Tax=Heliophilum fasciatum TaxID=35700 RepID=A0A4R2RUR8_9FIRM|nr:nitronate monooxygenase [Heliophilum fasciatum]MCW2278420.1 NAD(P)H-dependent flavin oxidoreductase YrpB (nitropropane dioxygenase family) [Heliophilum fasciatum]TCP63681.1 NAD(P)H-dependent flavin oxidoreductase YrpB (nitropropane dioxygenase family) [Heliophilum fasciatum]
MKLPELRIGHLVAKVPIVQGGMAIRVSTAPLAAAVANQGGIGVIAITGMTVDEIRREIRLARQLSSGIIGVNCLFAAREFATLVKTAIEEGIDLVISGAGFSRDMFQWGKESGTPIVPIVSSARLAKIAKKMGAAAVVVEGKEAGGHLGTDESMKKIVPEVVAAVDLPVIAAGGIIDGRDIVDAFKLGAQGVQMATRFVASDESGAAPEFKEVYLKATHDDVVLIDSPVGLPGRGLKNPFWHKMENGEDIKPRSCNNCLKECTRRFCIVEALDRAQKGDMERGLVFSGEYVERIKDVLPVKTIFERLLQEVEACD